MDGATDDNGIVSNEQTFERTMDGSIVSIKLENFMTLSDVEYIIHPKLNLIIGLDEYGKSSIITAFILGFGDSSKNAYGRNDVRKFVKQGKSITHITIELYMTSKKNIILRRSIFAIDGRSNYYIDNLPIGKSKYVHLVKSLNIKVYNLSQFFLQYKMKHFSELDSKGLLLNALQCTENNQLLKIFHKLLNITSCTAIHIKEISRLTETIKLEMSTNIRLKMIVDSFNDKQILEYQLLDLIQQKSWYLYVLTLKQIKHESKEIDDANKYNCVALSLIDEQKKIIKNAVYDKLKKISMQQSIIENVIWKNLCDKVNDKNIISKMNKIHTAYKRTVDKIQFCEACILSKKEILKEIKNNTFSIEDYNEEFVEIQHIKKKNNDCIDLLKTQLKEIRIKINGQIKNMFDINEAIEKEKQNEELKNSFLQNEFPEIWKAIIWLRNCDKTIFHGQVFEPLFTQIEVLDPKNAMYIEHIIHLNDMLAFVFEYKSDSFTFNRIIKEEGWDNIHSVVVPPPTLQIDEIPQYDINSLKKYGFHSYTLDTIRTPSIIRRYLMKTYDMHNILIGSEKVLRYLLFFPKLIKMCYAGKIHLIRDFNSDGTTVSLEGSGHVEESKLLLFYVNPDLIRSMVTKMNEAKVEYENVKKQEIELTDWLNVSLKCYNSVLVRETELKRILFKNDRNYQGTFVKLIKFTQSQLERQRKRHKLQLKENLRINEMYIKSAEKVVDLLDNYAKHIKLLLASAFIFNNCRNVNEKEKLLEQLKTLYKENSNYVDEYLNYIHQLESQFLKKKEVALYWSRGASLYDTYHQLNDDFIEIDLYDVEMLNRLIFDKKTKLLRNRNVFKIDPKAQRVLQEYNERITQINKMQDKCYNLNNYVKLKTNEVKRIHLEWFPSLQEFCSQLNTHFQRFLKSFGCSGFIELVVGESLYDYQSYGLSISTQFSNDISLLLLGGKRSSDNNRSLMNSLFWFTLQDISHYPFRIVGKIGKDIDGLFERKMTEFLMELFENGTKQCLFTITPELMEKLSFNTSANIIFCTENDNK